MSITVLLSKVGGVLLLSEMISRTRLDHIETKKEVHSTQILQGKLRVETTNNLFQGISITTSDQNVVHIHQEKVEIIATSSIE